MEYGKKAARKEKKIHDELLKLLSKHFAEDEEEMLDGDEDPMSKFMGLSGVKSHGDSEDADMEYEEGEEEDKEGEDDDYYDELMEEEESPKQLDKDARKNLAIILITKKAAMDNRKRK